MKDFNHNHAFNTGYAASILPQQALPSRKKTKKWKQATADALEREGLRQVRENLKYVDYYKSIDGDLTEVEVSDLLPHLKHLPENMRRAADVPSFLRNYDLIGTIVRTFIGWMTDSDDQYFVVGLDDYETNEWLYDKTFLLHSSLEEQWNLTLNRRLVQMGLDPALRDFGSEEEAAAYIEQVNQARQSITPPEIESWMKSSWKSTGVRWGESTYESDKLRFDMKELDEDAVRDYMITGKWFRHNIVGFDYYRPEEWSPIEVFHDKSPGLRYPQNGDFAGRITFMTPTNFITRYGHLMTAKEKQMMIGGDEDWSGRWNLSGDDGDYSKRKPSLLNWYKNELIPYEGYYDRQSILAMQNFTGNPMGETHYIGTDGKEKVVPSYLKNDTFNPSSYNANLFKDIHGDYSSRRGLIQVMEAYCVSWKRVFYICYESESGLILQQLVTDELLPEFLEENNLTKKNLTITKAMEDPEVNTYIEDYIPEVRRFIKASGMGFMESPLYLDGDPIDYQIKGDSNMYDFQLPVTGYLGSSPVERAMPYQAMYNFSLNKLRNMEGKEIGPFALFDVNLIPSEFADFGDTEEAFNALTSIAKTTGLLAVDMSRNNTAQTGGTPFNQFAQYNLAYTEHMIQCINNAMMARNMAFETFGITPQILGTPQRYTTAEGVRQGVNATMIQVQEYFNHMDWSKKKSINTHLAIAQMCQKNGKDQSFFYTKSDLSKQFVYLSDTEDIPLRHLGVMAISDSAMRRKVEGLKQALAQMNFAGDDVMSWAKMFTSKSLQELMEAAGEARKRQNEVMQMQSEQQQQLQAQQQQYLVEDREDRQAHEIQKESLKVEGAIQKERVRAAGVAAGKDSNAESLQFVDSQAKNALAATKAEADAKYKEAIVSAQTEANKTASEMKKEELELKRKQLELKNKEIEAKIYTSTINKN